ncbi:carbohydrate ABC transporter permease [Brachybacterium fresconis]|uniref:Multiple sugar transport system permease protein n=1 Tax=Brachybacterium fresconis TaxID=173363 RepID=A0ABS4YQG3_9MICO|nr:sugar ABC transporter permease [Brachybacterium fresconis]MBP2411036.1 multiple sugar transport system permease protein [Brachybacterium fresconis]
MSASNAVAADTPRTGTSGSAADLTARSGPGARDGTTGGRSGKRKLTGREKRNLRVGLLFISPWIIGVAVFVVYPLVYSFVISLTQYSGMQSPTFIGFQNYIAAFVDPLLHTAVGNTVYYMLLAVPIGLVVALLLALAMNRNVREVALYRTLLYLPSLIPMFALSFIFIVFVNPQYGIVNQFLGLFGMPATNLLGDPRYAKIVMIVMAQLGAGNAALIYLAGLRNIPETLYEAARIDGASRFRQFFAITVPLLTPTILFNLITGVSGAMMVFTEAFIMTDGGPDNSTLFYMLYLWRNAFSYGQLGFASALAVLLFLFGMLLAGLIYWLSRRFVNYDVSAG